MTSFGWKRKVGGNVCKSKASAFSSEAKDDHDKTAHDDIDWLTSTPKKRFISLEDAVGKSDRLKAEGAMLAEADRYWEAIKKWDEAIQLTPYNEKIFEMKAQALMAVGEVFPAMQMAEKTVVMAPTWWVGHQTLGRALANIGEVRLALKSFSRAVHLNPADQEMWTEDLLWTKSLLERKKIAAEPEQVPRSTLTVRELEDDCDSTSSTSSAVTGERSVMPYNAGLLTSTEKSFGKNIKWLPSNYIQMRDPT
ncbi:unnamed protein product [Lymnaea stagnalis]|uniref:Tetratricopeptide repeat protein 33 n=1 Tax=Lymnaea stagnalis TaxID=6523 RepID=A0AAV2HJ95_LYMST